MTSPEPLLQVRDLRVQVGERTVLHSVSLDVNAGSLVVLMGANGSGKSPLGLALAGHPAYQVLAGQALLAGQPLRLTSSTGWQWRAAQAASRA